jgi:hypothetical protein
MLSRPDLHHTCCVPIFENDQMAMEIGQFANSITTGNFRVVDWSNKVNQLVDIIDQGHILCFATDLLDQLNFLKSYFKDRIMTVSVSYDADSYDDMLTWFAKRHIHLQNTQRLSLTLRDQELRNQSVDLVEYYKQEFDQQQLLPKYILPTGEYDIPLRDFFHRDNFFQHLKNIEGQPSTRAFEYYDRWYSSNIR